MINLEEPKNESLEQVIKNLENGIYLIPDFQRDYDWNASDINELLISIFSDYYIGNLLLWNTNEENIKSLSCEHIKGFSSNDKIASSTIVLDGQQRLTSLYYAFFSPSFNLKGRKTKVEFFININEFLDGNYDKAIYYEWKKHRLNNLNNIEYLVNNKIYPIKNFPKIGLRNNDYSRQYERIYGADETDKLINKLNDTFCHYKIPVIELKRNIDIPKVCDIFEKINSRGIKLSTFDLLNSILKQQGIQLRSELWEKASQQLDFIEDDKKIYILQNMSIIEQNYCSAKYLYYLVPKVQKIIKDENNENKETILIQTKEEFINKWNNSIKALERAERELKDYSINGFGIFRRDFFPYISMLPIYAAISQILNLNKDISSINIKKIKKWWYYSIFTNNYSSSVESTMAKDYQDIQKWFKNESNDMEKSINKYIEDFNLDLYKETNGSAIYKAILNLIITDGATDFYAEKTLAINDLNDHHIVPKAFCERLNIKNKSVNSILNRTLIYNTTNNNIKDKAPSEYIKNIREKYSTDIEMEQMFEKHFISKKALEILKKENFNSNDFEEFIKEREYTILDYIKTKIFEIY